MNFLFIAKALELKSPLTAFKKRKEPSERITFRSPMWLSYFLVPSAPLTPTLQGARWWKYRFKRQSRMVSVPPPSKITRIINCEPSGACSMQWSTNSSALPSLLGLAKMYDSVLSSEMLAPTLLSSVSSIGGKFGSCATFGVVLGGPPDFLQF